MGDGPPGFSRDSTCPAILRNPPSEPARFRLPGSHRLRPTVPGRSTNGLVCDSPASRPDRPCNPGMQARRFGLFRVRSPLLAESLLFSFPAGTEMVHFPALSSSAYVFSRRYPGITLDGFPHSEISGSTLVCSSPKLIAACHVLHRLLAPRHPPYALSSLTIPGSRRTAGIGSDALPTSEPRRRPRHCVITEATVCGVFSCQTSSRRGARKSAPCERGRAVDDERARKTENAWWRIPGSNRRPPGCKPGALPAELIPPNERRPPARGAAASWWAWVDSNYRPHAYQACALTD